MQNRILSIIQVRNNQIVDKKSLFRIIFGKWKWIVKAKSVSLFRNTPTLTLKLI